MSVRTYVRVYVRSFVRSCAHSDCMKSVASTRRRAIHNRPLAVGYCLWHIAVAGAVECELYMYTCTVWKGLGRHRVLQNIADLVDDADADDSVAESHDLLCAVWWLMFTVAELRTPTCMKCCVIWSRPLDSARNVRTDSHIAWVILPSFVCEWHPYRCYNYEQ